MGYQQEAQESIPGRGKVSLFSKILRLALGPTEPPIQWILGALFSGIQRPGREA
jgi:hypothetical protein